MIQMFINGEEVKISKFDTKTIRCTECQEKENRRIDRERKAKQKNSGQPSVY